MITKIIQTAEDLITSHKATVEGFMKQALVKTSKATPYSEAATKFYQALQQVQDINSLDLLLDDENYREGLIAAAGFSKKATDYASKTELDDAILRVLSTLKETGGDAFREELVYRFLLTMGDTLGGSMRNYIGNTAKRVLSDIISAALNEEMITKIGEEGNVQGFTWDKRLLLFDIKPKLIDKNVDAILFDISEIDEDISLAECYSEIVEARRIHSKLVLEHPEEQRLIRPARSRVLALERQIKEIETVIKANPSAYLAGGELKGGIDPAGADEHWKTARSALDRISEKFEDQSEQPKLFYVAAAIQKAQANEIFDRLQKNTLTYAANLTVPEQVTELATWLINL